MKRLSDRLLEIINEQDFCFTPEEMRIVEKALRRLAAYEDTGLEPEEINEVLLKAATLETIESMYDGLGHPDHLRELVQAEKDGRLVVLPCKVGDTVCKIFGDKIYEMKAVAIPLLISSTGAHLSITSTNNRGSCLSLELSDFGKTVFLTREEAEVALEAQKGGDER